MRAATFAQCVAKHATSVVAESNRDKRMKAYYARPITLYGTPQEQRDEDLIRALGFEPIDVKKEDYQGQGMDVFKPLVEGAKALFFRSFPDMSIGAGVAKEIAWAKVSNLPIVELPHLFERRILSVDETRRMLAYQGKR